MNTQHVIIFEGHDRAGKSTIAKALSEKMQIPVFKVSRDKRWWDPEVNLKYLTEGITQFIEKTGVSVILDRWIGSDYMYSKLFNRDISYEKIFELDSRLSLLNTLFVVCYKDAEAHIPDTEDADYVDMSQYATMTANMIEFSNKSKCNFIFINTSDANLEEQVKKILAHINFN